MHVEAVNSGKLYYPVLLCDSVRACMVCITKTQTCPLHMCTPFSIIFIHSHNNNDQLQLDCEHSAPQLQLTGTCAAGQAECNTPDMRDFGGVLTNGSSGGANWTDVWSSYVASPEIIVRDEGNHSAINVTAYEVSSSSSNSALKLKCARVHSHIEVGSPVSQLQLPSKLQPPSQLYLCNWSIRSINFNMRCAGEGVPPASVHRVGHGHGQRVRLAVGIQHLRAPLEQHVESVSE